MFIKHNKLVIIIAVLSLFLFYPALIIRADPPSPSGPSQRNLIHERDPRSPLTAEDLRTRDQIRDLITGQTDQRIPRFRDDEIIVKFKDNPRFQRIKLATGEELGQALARYRIRADVQYAELNYLAYAQYLPNDPYYSYQWNFKQIGAEQAWDLSNGSGVIVAVIDTGVAYENYSPNRRESYYRAPDLANTSFASGYDFVNNDSHPNDDQGHGTHVAGTIAQSTGNSLGVAGIAYGAKLMPVKVLDKYGSGTYADIADGIRWAADHGAKVINLSLGGPLPATYLEEALAYANSKGLTIVAAAGNDNQGSLLYPAAYNQYVIAVGATRYDKTLAYYSNYGPGLDLVAPGGDLTVDQNNDGYGDGILQQTFGTKTNQWGYYFYQGTSMATPQVAGLAALLIAHGNATTPDQIKTALEQTAQDLGPNGPDNTYGYGLINAAAALNWSAGPVDSPPSVSLTSPTNNAEVKGAITIAANAQDDQAISQVKFYLNNQLLYADTTNPYEYGWDSNAAADGAYTIEARAYDSQNQSASDSVSIMVNNLNDPPVAQAGPDQTVIDSDNNGYETVYLNGSSSFDPDGSIIAYEWKEGSDLIGSSPGFARDFTLGSHNLILTVTDNQGLNASDNLLITVNSAPSEITVFSDSFEAGQWNGLWIEGGQNDWFTSSQRSVDGSYSAEVDGSANDALLTSIPIDLGGKNNATISFAWYIESSLDSGEYLAFDVSTNGGASWTNKAMLRGNLDQEDQWHNQSINITSVSSLMIRFRGKMSRSNEDADVDLVKVVAW